MPGGNKNVICNFTNHLSILLEDLLSMFLGLHISPPPPPALPITCIKCVNRKPGEGHPSSFSVVSTTENLQLQPAWSKICLRFVCSAEYSAAGALVSKIPFSPVALFPQYQVSICCLIKTLTIPILQQKG